MKPSSVATATPLDTATLPATGDPWRPIHYLGSKLRALASIGEALDAVSEHNARVYDLFAGSGTVSRWLANTRPVTAVDIQEYSRVICSALLNPAQIDTRSVRRDIQSMTESSGSLGVHYAAAPLIELEAEALDQASGGDASLLADMIEAGSLMTANTEIANKSVRKAFGEARVRISALAGHDLQSSMILRHFGGIYFSYRQAADLDVILTFAHISENPERETLVAAALSSASELVNTVGKQFAQPIRPRSKQGSIKPGLVNLAMRDRLRNAFSAYANSIEKYLSQPDAAQGCIAVRSDYRDFLASASFDDGVVYADPPYTRDHYSRFYHVLETMALRDDPAISSNTVRGKTSPSRGAYREDRHQSPFCIRSQAPDAFDELFSRVAKKGMPIVVSYSPYAAEKDAHPRVMEMGVVEEIAGRYYAKVELVSVGEFFHSRLNRSDLNKEIAREAEFLLLCK
jgi:adenine-specific DNA-methyltransferase